MTNSQLITLTKIPRSQLVTSIKSTRHTVTSSHGELVTVNSSHKFKKITIFELFNMSL